MVSLEWPVAMCSHVLNKRKQRDRSYGHWSNVARLKWKMLAEDDLIPSILKSEKSSKEPREKQGRLI